MNLVETIRATALVLDKRTKRTLLLATIASVAISILDALAIALILPLVNLASGADDTSGFGARLSQVLGQPDERTLLISMTVAVVTLFILKDVGGLLFTWWLTSFKVLKRVDLSTQLLDQLLHAPYTAVSRRSSSEMLRTVNDAVFQFFNTTVFGLMTLASNISSLIMIAAALLITAPLPSLALGTYFTLGAVFYLYVMKPHSQRAGAITAEASTAAYRTALAALAGIKEAKLRGSQAFFVGAYRKEALRGAYAGRTAGFISATPRYLLEILFILAVGALLLGGTVLGTGSTATGGVGILALFVAAGLRALPAVTSMMGQFSNLRFASRYVEIVLDEVRNNPVTPNAPQNELSRFQLQDQIRVDDVSFRYPESDRNALSGVTLEIRRGTSVALVGGSGAGKTTLVDLLLGLHVPTHGSITVDGVNIKERLQGWQLGIGYVPQDVFLRDATLAENVAFDQPSEVIDRDRVLRAIERAQLADVVTALPDGLDTPVGERGSRLSGGQRQRIGIARALYQNPRLLVLDEATSALDNETEHRISEAIRALHGTLTTIIVAHRLSTVRHVDMVVMLHEGRVEAVGSFDEVRRMSSRFDRMAQLGSLS